MRFLTIIVLGAAMLWWSSNVYAQGCGTSQLSCRQLAVQDAQAAGIDPATFVAQIQAESGFNPSARNPNSGATGIAQFLPSTAANAGFGIASFSPTDPVASLQAAAQYDAALAARDGSLTAALTDYSGGLTPANPGTYGPVFAAAAAAAGGPGALGTPLSTPAAGLPAGATSGSVGGTPAAAPAPAAASGQTVVTDPPGTGVGAGSGVLDQIVAQFQNATSAWQGQLLAIATDLFWILALIELLIALILLVISGRPDWSDVAATIIRWLLPVGLFWWLLQNGSGYAQIIIDSLRLAGAQIGGTAITPSAVFWAGVNIVVTIWNNSHGFLGTIEQIPVMIAAIPIVIAFSLAAVWMLMTLIEAFIKVGLAALFLAFAGLRWTRGIAITFLMSCLGVGFRLLAMQVITGIGASFITQWSQNAAGLSFQGIFIMLGASIAIAALVKIVPESLERIVAGYISYVAQPHHFTREAAGAAALVAAPVLAAGGFTALAVQAFKQAAEQLASNQQQSQSALGRAAQIGLGAAGGIASSAGSEISGRMGGLYRGSVAASAARMAMQVAQNRRVNAAAQARPAPPSGNP